LETAMEDIRMKSTGSDGRARISGNILTGIGICISVCFTPSHALITRSVGPNGDYPTIGAALTALTPFSDDVVLQVNTGFNGYEEAGGDYNSAINFNGHTLDLLAAQSSSTQITYYVGSDLEYRTDLDGNLETVESVNGGAFSARRVYAGSGSSGGTEYLVKNHLGSTAAMTDEGGHALGTYYEYAAYGTEDKLQSGPVSRVTQTFTGKELDEDVDLYYYGARYYDPDLSLWFSPDPAREFPSPFAYSPSPILTVDPTGKRTHVVVTSSHVAFYVDNEHEKPGNFTNFLWDGNGDYLRPQRGAGDFLDLSLYPGSSFDKFIMRESKGHELSVFTFNTTAEEEGKLYAAADYYGEAGGMGCATSASRILTTIPLFGDRMGTKALPVTFGAKMNTLLEEQQKYNKDHSKGRDNRMEPYKGVINNK